jgi:hypothetical protein
MWTFWTPCGLCRIQVNGEVVHKNGNQEIERISAYETPRVRLASVLLGKLISEIVEHPDGDVELFFGVYGSLRFCASQQYESQLYLDPE